MKSVFFAASLSVALFSHVTLAQDAPATDGASLYKSKTCVACHGAEGKKGLLPSYPKLNGQNKDYLIAQMKDIKSGARANGQSAAMKGVMHLVNDAEIEAIAVWLATVQ
jgi:cytochrome c